jgi:AcrR family transcriptional regulator
MLKSRSSVPQPAAREASTRQRFLDAGARVFVRHGYAGASMEQVADEAGLSRAALYKHFENKEALFLAAAGSLHQGAVEAAEAVARRAMQSKAAPVKAILDFMLAKHRHYAEQLGDSPHAEELAEESSRRCGALVRRTQEHFRAQLTGLIASYSADGRIALKPNISPAALADMLIAAGKGVKSETQFDEPRYEAAFNLMAKTIVAGATRRS